MALGTLLASKLTKGSQSKAVASNLAQSAYLDDDELTQKKAYKVLISIFKEHVGFLSRKLDETVELMLVAKPLYNASTKKRRLECLHNLILYIFKGRDESMSDITLTFLSEIILAVKNSNKKIRTSAYEFLVQIGHGLVYESSGSSNEDLLQFFSMTIVFHRSPNVSISKKRKREESVHLGGSKPEAGLNDSKATIKECMGRKQKRHLINFKPRSHSADQSSRNQANSAGASRPKFQNEHKISKLRKKPERSMSSSSHLDAQNASSRSVGKTTRQKKSFDGGLSSCGKGKRSAARKKVGTSINSGPNIMHSPSAKLSMPKRKQKFNKRKGKKNTSE